MKITTTSSRVTTTAGEPRPSLEISHWDTSGHPARRSFITSAMTGHSVTSGGSHHHRMEEDEEEEVEKEVVEEEVEEEVEVEVVEEEEQQQEAEAASTMSPGCLSSEGGHHRRHRSDCPESGCSQHCGTSPTVSSGRRGRAGGGRSQAKIMTGSGTPAPVSALALALARQGGATAGGGTKLVPTERSREETAVKRRAPR